MFQYKYEKLTIVMWHIILIMLLYLTWTAGECNVCQGNQAACINSTSFYLCFGDNEPITDTLYHCNDGFYCTDLNVICVQTSSTNEPSCGDTSLCGLCSVHRNYLFACLSRTTFQMCYGGTQPTGQIGYCPTGYVCYGSSDAVCVLEDSVDSITCDVVNDDDDGDNDDDSTSSSSSTTSTSTESTTTETTTTNIDLTPTQVCEQMQETGLHPTIPNDSYCIRYIYCFYSDGILQGTEQNCPSATYYHIEQEQCVFNKPTYCL